jgi:hypothetical protein
MLRTGTGVPQDVKTAVNDLESLALLGHIYAQVSLCSMKDSAIFCVIEGHINEMTDLIIANL